MIKILTLILSANLYISVFYQLKPFYDKVSSESSEAGAVLYIFGFILLVLNLLTTYSTLLLVNGKYVKWISVKSVSATTLLFNFIFLFSFFNNHFNDCLLLSLPLLLVNFLVVIFAFSPGKKRSVVSGDHS
jgi:hypothetical protein